MGHTEYAAGELGAGTGLGQARYLTAKGGAPTRPADQGRKLEQVANEIVPGGTLLRAWDLTGGISAEMTALEVEGPDGTRSRMIVRQHGEADRQGNPNIATDEFRLLQILHAEGVAAPAPLHLDASGQILPLSLIHISEPTRLKTRSRMPSSA